MKEFYEGNGFDEKKLKVKSKIASNKLEENLWEADKKEDGIGSETNVLIMKPFFEKANENKNLDEILELREAAEYLRVVEMKELIDCTIASVVYISIYHIL
jgi:hypothetical protein